MTKSAPLLEDIITAVARPVIAFFVGMVIGHLARFAEVAGWPLALGIAGALAVIALAVIWLDTQLRRLFDGLLAMIGLAPRVKPQLVAPPKRRKHWFVRFGWVIGLTAGVLAIFVLPDEVLAWL